MALTKIQRGMLGTSAVIVPDNIFANGVASTSTFLRGDGSWTNIKLFNQNLDTTSSVKFYNLTVTNVLTFGDGTKMSSANSATITWDKIQNVNNVNGPALNIRVGRNAGKDNITTGTYIPYDDGIPSHVIPIDPVYGAQGMNGIAIGDGAGSGGGGYSGTATSQSGSGIAIGQEAKGLGFSAVAIGQYAGGLGRESIAIGRFSEGTGDGAVAIGVSANGNGTNSVAIGYNAGGAMGGVQPGQGYNQGYGSISIGALSAFGGQQEYAIYLGVGHNVNQGVEVPIQPNNSIVLNATGLAFNITNSNSFYVNPIRSSSATSILYYNPTTYEITQGAISAFDPDQGVL